METRLPLLVALLPLLAALPAQLLGRRRRAATAVGLVAVALLLALVALAGALAGDATAVVFGPTLTLATRARGLLALLYVLTGGVLLLDWFRPVGRGFVPLALAALAPLAAALMAAPAGVALVLLAVGLGVLAAALYGGRYEAAAAAWRAFLMGVLGLTPLIWVAWAGAAGQATGEMARLGLLLATLLLLGGFPFHIWLRGLARWASPGALALALGPGQIVVVALLTGLLDVVPAVRAAPEFQTALRGCAVFATLLAALLLARERTPRGALGAALALDAGWLALTALTPGAAGLTIALAALAGRTLSLLLIALGWRWPAGGRAARLGPLLSAYGFLSLLGLPLTPGFAGRWAQATLLGGGAWAAVGIAALAVAAWALWRAISMDMSPAEGETVAPGRAEVAAAVALLALAGLLGLFPGLLTAVMARLVG
ncbi:MAG: hypothetical protein KIT52_20105 [Anaerolineae bacterium]|nr:hypothetical protein [Anaerolineae bacterium]